MKTPDYQAIDQAALWHPYTRQSSAEAGLPVIVSAEGCDLIDSDGNHYLDAISSWWACNLGHSHPRLVHAIQAQAETLQHSILGNLSHPNAIELAQQLSDLFPTPRMTHYASDGACAVEIALKIALQRMHIRNQPERNKIVSIKNAYHGDTLATVSIGFIDAFHKPFESMRIPTLQAEAPCTGDCGGDQCDLTCFDSMHDILTSNTDTIAAVIVEPLCQGAGGMRIYSADYLTKLAALCQQHEILLIVDEIAVGFGRTGRFFAHEHANIDPDIVCIGKSLSGGYLPISAAIVKREIYDLFSDTPTDNTFYHGHTFAGNPIATAVALELLAIYQEDNIVKQAKEKGEALAHHLATLADNKNVKQLRCLGLIGAVELHSAEHAKRVQEVLKKKHILIRPLGAVVYLMPPLNLPDDTLQSLCSAFVEAISSS